MPPCYVPMCRTLGISPTVLDRNDVRRDAFIALPDMIGKRPRSTHRTSAFCLSVVRA